MLQLFTSLHFTNLISKLKEENIKMIKLKDSNKMGKEFGMWTGKDNWIKKSSKNKM